MVSSVVCFEARFFCSFIQGYACTGVYYHVCFEIPTLADLSIRGKDSSYFVLREFLLRESWNLNRVLLENGWIEILKVNGIVKFFSSLGDDFFKFASFNNWLIMPVWNDYKKIHFFKCFPSGVILCSKRCLSRQDFFHSSRVGWDFGWSGLLWNDVKRNFFREVD